MSSATARWSWARRRRAASRKGPPSFGARRPTKRPSTRGGGRPLSFPGYLGAGLVAFAAAHAFGDDPDLLDPCPPGGVDHLDDVAVAQRRVADDEHRLLAAGLEHVAKLL